MQKCEHRFLIGFNSFFVLTQLFGEMNSELQAGRTASSTSDIRKIFLHWLQINTFTLGEFLFFLKHAWFVKKVPIKDESIQSSH